MMRIRITSLPLSATQFLFLKVYATWNDRIDDDHIASYHCSKTTLYGYHYVRISAIYSSHIDEKF